MAKSDVYDTKEKESFSLKGMLGDLMDIIEAVIVSMFVILMMFVYVLRPVDVEGPSMMPTLLDRDKVIMWKLGYTPKAGDIVIVDDYHSFTFADDTNTTPLLPYALILKRPVSNSHSNGSRPRTTCRTYSCFPSFTARSRSSTLRLAKVP